MNSANNTEKIVTSGYKTYSDSKQKKKKKGGEYFFLS